MMLEDKLIETVRTRKLVTRINTLHLVRIIPEKSNSTSNSFMKHTISETDNVLFADKKACKSLSETKAFVRALQMQRKRHLP